MPLFRVASNQELVDFTKMLSVMLKSGITINEALSELSEQTESRRFKNLLLEIKKDIESGTPLSKAFERKGNVFGGVTLAIIKAGETSGTLEENLNFLADWLEHDNDIRREVRGAMIYPAIVLGATVALSLALSLLVLPRLLPIFSQMGGELPLPTRILLGLTHIVKEYWVYIIAITVAFVPAFTALLRIVPVRRVWHRMLLHMPFIGSLLRQYQLTLICQLFATLFRSGLSITEILLIAGEGATNVVYGDALRSIAGQISSGGTLSDAMRKYPHLFSRSMLSIIAIGEKSGTLEDSFAYLTEYNRKEVFATTKRLPTIIEPVLLIFMGLLVAFIAISIIMPIYQFTANVRR
jgi:type II secretory pathway component PulF